MELKMEGLDELIDYLSKIETETEQGIDEALVAGGELLRDRVKSEVYSHGLTRRSGDAEKSIIRTDPENGTLYVGTQGGKRQPGYYLYMHEFGYYNVAAKRFISPKPLMSIVYENNKSAILEEYRKVFRRRYGL